MKRELKESFEIRVAGTEDWYSMTVPGSAMDTLVKAGVLPDPYYGENEYQVREFFRNDFDIRGHFTVSPEEFKAGHMLLVFNGIDTVADLYLNGHKLGHTENMHRRFTFDIKKYAKEGDNLLEIHLASPLNFIESYKPAKGREIHMCNTGTMPGNQYIRKPHCMFGWDWGPQLPDAGIFREIELVTYEKARLMDTLIRQKHEEGQVTLTMTTDVEKDADAKVKLTYEVMDPDGKLLYLGEDSSVKIEEPRLWWPHGSGEQPLYTVRVLMESEGEEAQEKLYRIGLRTVTVSREDDEWGQEFAITVNGKKIFARGADYIPDDCYYSRLTREVFLRDVQAAVFANFNCLRIWGGGYYPADEFYDLCDENGIIVWAEIPYITMHMADGTENTLSQMKELIVQNYHHPSIVCWGLSNEITAASAVNEELLENHRRLNNLCHELDKTRPTVMADVFMLETDSPMLEIPDMNSYNLYFGWYIGELEQNDSFFDEYHSTYPDRVIGLSEYGADANPAYHSANPERGDYTEEYQCVYHEHMAKMIEERPYLWATHVWNLFDFAADGRDEGGKHGENQKGLVTMDRRIKKDAFYVYKAYWSKDAFVHLCGSRYTDRAEDVTEIKVYSNQKKVTLFVDGAEQETKEGARIFRFRVPITGTHTIRAVSGDCTDEITVRKVDAPNPDYIFNKQGDVVNWFDKEDFKADHYSISDTLGELAKNEMANAIVQRLMAQASASRGDVAESVKDNPALQRMMQRMTLASLLKQAGDAVSEEQMRALNDALQKIPKN